MDSLDDIAYLRLKVRQDFARRDVTQKMESQMREWNLLDTKLFKHFSNVLTQKVRFILRRNKVNYVLTEEIYHLILQLY